MNVSRTRRCAAGLVVVALLTALAVPATVDARPAATRAMSAETPVSRVAPTLERWRVTPPVHAEKDAGPISALAADDGIPGVPLDSVSMLPSPVISGSVDAATDAWDVFSFRAAPGERIVVDAAPTSATSTLDIRLVLWGPGATSVGSLSLQESDFYGAGSEEWICYTIPGSAPKGTYYLGINAFAGSGGYEAVWTIDSRSDGNIPGVTMPMGSFVGDVDTVYDADDVFAVDLGVGQTLEATVSVDPASTVTTYLYGPGATDVWSSVFLDTQTGDEVHVTYAPGPGEAGTYYLDVSADDQEYLQYQAEWTTTGSNIPGVPLPPSPVARAGAPSQVYAVDLVYGQTFSATVGVPNGQADLYLFGPGAVDVDTSAPLVARTGTATSKSVAYSVPADGDGRYYVYVDVHVPVEYTITWSARTDVKRVYGFNRYATAVTVSQRDFPHGSDVVVVATGANFPDALAAGGLAGAYDAPILLVEPTALPSTVAAEIVRLKATRCFIVGGPAVVSDRVRSAIDALPGMTTPVRVAGSNRYATSAEVAKRVFTRQGVHFLGVGCLARGDEYADALALGPISWGAVLPVFLTEPGALPGQTEYAMTLLPVDAVAIAGGAGAVSAGVESRVDTLLGPGDDVERFGGSNRYVTAGLIADWSASSPFLDYRFVGIATGTNFPDALGGGPGCAKRGGVLLMTDPGALSAPTATRLSAKGAIITGCQVFGGTTAIPDATLKAVDARIP
ncbi:MAG: cell wall-binding repeat-containing protein [Anaerosomatales bacterium]|nr:cell wall-binding repeat-containing protein [Anaerosomatales bacterium]